jgi:putative ABC transport system permease protein
LTLARFVTKNAFRNKRRSILTVLSIAFSLLLLTLMMTVWRAFFIDQGTVQSAQRLFTRHKVSLVFYLPSYYREKIRALPGVAHVVDQSWFGGQYKDDRPENFFAQFSTDPGEFMDVYPEFEMPREQAETWKRDRTGCIVDSHLAERHKWKIGDRLFLKGTIFPVDLELTIRGIFSAPQSTESIYFNTAYIDEAYPEIKGLSGCYVVMADSAEAVPRVAREIDDAFRNSPSATKTESERAFMLGWIAMLGNVKAFILSISLAVVFATLLVSANTIAMSIRERTREVALLKTLGFTTKTVLVLFVSEAVALTVAGGVLGATAGAGLVRMMAQSSQMAMFLSGIRITASTFLAAVAVAATVGILSSFLPAYNAARRNIVEGLRHIG